MEIEIQYKNGKIVFEGTPTDEEREIYDSMKDGFRSLQEYLENPNSSEFKHLLAIGNIYQIFRELKDKIGDVEMEGILEIKVRKE